MFCDCATQLQYIKQYLSTRRERRGSANHSKEKNLKDHQHVETIWEQNARKAREAAEANKGLAHDRIVLKTARTFAFLNAQFATAEAEQATTG